jgi:hypothetical protein
MLAQACALTGQPERGASIAREGRQEAAEQGIEILVGYLLATEAMAWTAAGDYAAARRPAMEAVEVARRVQNPGLSAWAFCTAAGAIWPADPQAALRLIEDSLALTRAGASDPLLDTALTWAGFIRARNGDLPGALAALQEAVVQQHAGGNRLLLNMTLQIAAVVLARLGEAEPAAVLSGAFSAHFPPDISAVHQDVKMDIGEAQSLARRALGEAAYGAALARGAAMDDEEVAGYAQGEFGRLAARRAEPGAQAPEITARPGAAEPPGMTVLPRHDDVSPAGLARSGTTIIPASPQVPDVAVVAASAACKRWRTDCSLQNGCARCSAPGQFQAVPGIADRMAELDPAAADSDGADHPGATTAGRQRPLPGLLTAPDADLQWAVGLLSADG